MNNPLDLRYMWLQGTKAKSATSCGNAFVTNILLASAGGEISLLESPHFTSINVMSITP